MKQIIQDLKTGAIHLADVAVPDVKPGHLLLQTTCSLISAGTERMLVDFARAGYLAKARQQPEKVKQVIDKIRTDGLGAAVQSVMAKLDQPIPMGYCNVGRVLEVGKGVTGFRVGDRVASNGPHAEVVMVPKHLAAKIPDQVSDEEASFTILGAVALQGIRLIHPTLGETVAVFGLGLIGLLAVQMLQAHGARVIGFDFDSERVKLARKYGCQSEDLSLGTDPVEAAMAGTREAGVDGVLVTAATNSDELMQQAAGMCRKRGRIVLTGVTGLNLRRSDFYEKELTFQVSCSYGPGRYDPVYEDGGQDYPLGLVRWTEQRNFEAVLEVLRQKRLLVDGLISKRFPLHDAKQAYDAVAANSAIGVMLSYPEAKPHAPEEASVARAVRHHAAPAQTDNAVCGLIGAGAFAQQKILPALAATGARLKWVATSKGLSGSIAARKFGIEQSTTEAHRVFDDPEVNAVVIATRHNSHARLTIQALEAGKSVFVEKPLCLTASELAEITEAHRKACEARPGGPILTVGFNRRFAPLITRLKSQLAHRKRPLAMTFICNGGPVPADHWIQDPSVGGGRIIGEACHFIDLLHFLAGESPVVQVAAAKLGANDASNLNDTVSITLRFKDGSLGQVNYFANGAKTYPKERLEVFGEGRVFVIDNFRRLKCYGVRGKNKNCWTQDKGHRAEFQAFVDAIRTGRGSPIPFESLANTTKAALAAVEAIEHRGVIEMDRAVLPILQGSGDSRSGSACPCKQCSCKAAEKDAA
jgi:predicted dehydrogenase/threonine dehydrogenase-like Zn-dependent dehydrogenase